MIARMNFWEPHDEPEVNTGTRRTTSHPAAVAFWEGNQHPTPSVGVFLGRASPEDSQLEIDKLYLKFLVVGKFLQE